MLSRFVREGDRVEMTPVDKKTNLGSGLEEGTKVYNTKVANINSEDTLELLMPMEQTKLVLLPINSEFSVVFYTQGGLYQAFVKVIDRYKSDNLFIVAVELISNLRKYQRREFFRFCCALEMSARNLEEEELTAIEKKMPLSLQPNLPIRRSVIVDISGGGLRFMSNQKYETDSMIYCSYTLIKGDYTKKYELAGKVLSVRALDNRPGVYEHRVQYVNIDESTREEIISFIFEEERRNRQKK